MNYTINKDKFVGCRTFKKHCPVVAITGEKKQVHEINQDHCIKCGKYFTVCKFDYVIID
ncbi:hypothetical protein [Acetobacterium sp. MES1]|uniref:hypothetical protein n=1 Tax=Acetobacterium sp. MES1 TaxID=1899015 RepID=UPI00257E333D|nr:hypothetical protein [Acetobacterium sp. MES1]